MILVYSEWHHSDKYHEWNWIGTNLILNIDYLSYQQIVLTKIIITNHNSRNGECIR